MTASPDPIAAFVQDARGFFASLAESRPAGRRWQRGAGPDSVAAVEEASADEWSDLDRARKLQSVLYDKGYGWITGPREFGGAGLGTEYRRAFDRVAEEFDLPSRRALFVGMNIVAPAILEHGTADLKQRLLPALFRGDLVGCQLFSEPGAGSDLASVRTRGVRDGDDWVVTGQKVWTSEAHLADLGEALVRTDPDAPKHAGLTVFVIDMHAPGVTVRPLRQMTGGAAFNEVFLDAVRVSDANRIGAVGDGWRVAATSLTSERGQMSGTQGPLGEYVLDRLAELVRSAGAADDPVLSLRVAEVTATIAALKAAEERPADDWLPELRPVAGSVLKMLMVRALDQVGALVTELLGAKAFFDHDEWGTYGWSDFVLGVPGLHLAGGTDEIQRNLIAQRGLGLPRDSARPASAAGRRS